MENNQNTLGRLEQVKLRNIWTSESDEFTPWLAKEDNLILLGNAIGIELELEKSGKHHTYLIDLCKTMS